MRVCHVSPHLPPDQAANAILPAQLGRWAVEAGHEITFVTQDPAQGRAAADALAGPVRRVSNRRAASPFARLLKLDTVARARRIRTALDEMAGGASLLHLHSNGLIIEVAAMWARRRRVPFVLTLYGTEIWHYRKRWPYDPFTRAYRQAGAVTFYSRGLLEKARAQGLNRPELSVIYPAVGRTFAAGTPATRARWRQELGIGEPLVVLNVKRLHELAGQRYLVEAFARLARRRQDVRLIVCGTGPLRRELEAQAAAEGIAASVTFTGIVPNETVARYAGAADVFVLPSLLEALPTVAVEALAAGTPVISADHPGGVELNEIFGGDVSLVARRDVDALADALDRALSHPRRVAASTPALVDQRFGASAIWAAYLTLYERTLRVGGDGRRG
jgi:glycosyltransferase involved in cell wall biosynthesis